VLISLDGLYPEIYRRAPELGVQVPNLERLVREGTSADGLLGIFPTATYPSHTSLITGVRPAVHGVVANTVFAPGVADAPWYWFADSVRVRTLPGAVARAGLAVGVSNWPALVGSPDVRWHLPEIWSLGSGDAKSGDKTRRWATPGLVEEVERRFGPWSDERFEWGRQDDRITDGAVVLIEAKRPALLLVHLVEVDHVLHETGRNSEAALRAFETADRQIGRILAALDGAGLQDSTHVVVVGDHGFANVHTEFRPNAALAAAGLEVGSANWRVRVRTTTAAAALYARGPSEGDPARRASDVLRRLASGRYAGVFEVLSTAEVERYGTFPGSVLVLACRPGYSFSGRDRGEVLAASGSRGMHGYRPEDPLMHSGFVARGPRFPTGLRVPLLRMLDVAPTLAAVLGCDLGPAVEGIVVPGLLRPADAAIRGR
jgi:predicted AlkP superfamily pyrophosphatase or phosphodiesterase